MSDRAKHLEDIRGSLALEGLRPDADTDRLLEEWAVGEVTSEDLDAAVKRLVASAKAESQAS